MAKAKSNKPKIKYQENFNKGVFVDKEEIIGIINRNIDTIEMELKNRGVMTDDTEFMTIKLSIPHDE